MQMESAGAYGTGGVARRCWNSHGVDQTTIKRRCKPAAVGDGEDTLRCCDGWLFCWKHTGEKLQPALPVMEMAGSGAATG